LDWGNPHPTLFVGVYKEHNKGNQLYLSQTHIVKIVTTYHISKHLPNYFLFPPKKLA
jgi:hypothetical protein